MKRFFVASTLGNDPHTEGLHIASKIAKLGEVGYSILEPTLDYEPLLDRIKEADAGYIGLSYRLSPQKGLDELKKVLALFFNTGLIKAGSSIRIAFSGLPETIKMVQAHAHELPCKVYLMQPHPNVIDRITDIIDFFDIVHNREQIIGALKDELEPPGISILDEIADEVVFNNNYLTEPPLDIPSNKAIGSYTTRIKEANRPIIRSHFGIPADTIEPTIDGIREIAEARVIDEVSLGSSDLSQRYFGLPEMFDKLKNDGGVPYKNEQDLIRIFNASRAGNFPSVKPYCHVTGIVDFIDVCIRTGMLVGAHQAIPLFWFNELDGRGAKKVPDSIAEHCEAVKELSRRNIPAEMNDPNQWSSRWAHDTVIVASYGLVSAVMTMNEVKDMVLQMQFNKPRETGDFADLAKMTAGLEIAAAVSKFRQNPPTIYRETRTGIESLSPNMEKARWQLGRSTLLQMFVDPHILHLVSFCEANHAAKPADIIESSKIVRKAVRLFNENKIDLMRELDNPIIQDRKKYLMNEAEYLLKNIAALHPEYKGGGLRAAAAFLAKPDVLAQSIKKRYMTAPGIVHSEYKNPDIVTRPTKYGFIDVVDSETGQRVITEKERLSL
ncbi:MAG: hypothetical protein ITG00_01730 [Flavobacterium sp.]|nr:hypothetical protein [Flavobacterium sp.]